MALNRTWLLILAGTIVMSACSTADSVVAPTTLELTTTTAAEVITTTSTTAPPETTTTVDPQVAEVEAAVDLFLEEILTVMSDPSAPVERLSDVATGEVLASITRYILKARAEGRVFGGTFILSSSSTVQSLGDGTFLVTRCGLDAVSETASDGTVTDEADTDSLRRAYAVEQTAAGLRVSSVTYPGGEATQCEL